MVPLGVCLLTKTSVFFLRTILCIGLLGISLSSFFALMLKSGGWILTHPFWCLPLLNCWYFLGRSQNNFHVYPLPGILTEGGNFYYDCIGDISSSNFATFLAYAAYYDHPMLVHNCPDLVAFQVDHPTAHIWPFSKLSPQIILREREVMALASPAALAELIPPLTKPPRP